MREVLVFRIYLPLARQTVRLTMTRVLNAIILVGCVLSGGMNGCAGCSGIGGCAACKITGSPQTIALVDEYAKVKANGTPYRCEFEARAGDEVRGMFRSQGGWDDEVHVVVTKSADYEKIVFDETYTSIYDRTSTGDSIFAVVPSDNRYSVVVENPGLIFDRKVHIRAILYRY